MNAYYHAAVAELRYYHAAVAELRRLRDARIGADRQNPGKYAIYWYDQHGEETRSAGNFASVNDASEAVDFLIVESLIDAYEDMLEAGRAA